MLLFIPKEIKKHEYRVGLTPSAAAQLVADGHDVAVERSAGWGAGLRDEEYEAAGAQIVATSQEGYARADLVVKVKEPLPAEYSLLRPDQVVFTYFHFAADETLTRSVLDSGATAVAYETLMEGDTLPLLIPMSEVAGRMSIQAGAKHLENPQGGRGVLLGGVPGVPPAHVTILGGGVVGTEAAKMAAGLGARVHILDINLPRLRQLSEMLPSNVVPLFSDPSRIQEELIQADLVVGAVLIQGARTPRLIQRSDLRRMKRGSVLVDVAIDQGGCADTSRPTTHDDPVYEEEGVVHYCVANMPGAVSRTSTFALTHATFPYVRRLAACGLEEACERHPSLRSAINIQKGRVRHPGVAAAWGLEHVPL